MLLFAFCCWLFLFCFVFFSACTGPPCPGDRRYVFFSFPTTTLHLPLFIAARRTRRTRTHILCSKRFTFDVFPGLISWVFAPLNWHWESLLKPLLLLYWLFYFEERNHRLRVFSSGQCTALLSPSDFLKHQSFELHSECPLRFPENRQKPRFGNSRLHPSSGGQQTCRRLSVAGGVWSRSRASSPSPRLATRTCLPAACDSGNRNSTSSGTPPPSPAGVS